MPSPTRDSLSHPEFNRVPDLCGFINRFNVERLVPTSVVLSAHVWRSWARSLNLPSNQILKLLFSINIRDRVKLSLPSGFYGNAFVVGCAQTTVKDLTERGLNYATMLVRQAKERVGDDYVKSVVEAVSNEIASPDSVGDLDSLT
ncbi:unnamed protein product [Arabidopsis arenosa]|uniref:Uncharacterized protein n=1 Tax=Arabidopsis arenosa TaxID=38785 RepID=A0A8S1ZRZ2_ARAAE|nr:unnamed protein product [Arabidopsis arenosa]